MSTVTILIGNSDDKLTQRRWSEFVREVGAVVADYADGVEFSGLANGAEWFQNACWVARVGVDVDGLRSDLRVLAGRYDQDSIALVVGAVEFVAARAPHSPRKAAILANADLWAGVDEAIEEGGPGVPRDELRRAPHSPTEGETR